MFIYGISAEISVDYNDNINMNFPSNPISVGGGRVSDLQIFVAEIVARGIRDWTALVGNQELVRTSHIFIHFQFNQEINVASRRTLRK